MAQSQSPQITEVFFDQATYLLKRFDFRTFDLSSITIDTNVLAFFEHILSSRSVNHLKIAHITLDSSIGDAGIEKFVSAILNARLNSITLLFSFLRSIVEVNFMIDYANSVILPNLIIGYYVTDIFPPVITLSKDFAITTLSRFETFHVENVVVNADWILPALLTRLCLRKAGEWEFFTTRQLDGAEIEAVIDPYMKYEPDGEKHIIRLIRTIHKVKIDPYAGIAPVIRQRANVQFSFRAKFY
ncbi:hypothetical protein PMAYCL1PPCAC_25291 [Pristionchus mayeri]|uniref:Uncharacterized protein n=1 Tax=Pristionchus mayeri TaxID=1317129 RepID=A0AAN5D3S8_9BILA|nr:hypothetical protein PMAYCL1PPCAC_25284 [Pristionchus mayeri]GMR55096.1 hypothetical protein PMAYCL1PPCAC_25291 [Pristionchus mayeri]